jgi:myosin-5
MISNLQLKPLCSLILKKTINDPDKYQNGLTKIFFRAGMLAALESLRSDRLNALVTIVQKNMRRRVAVKKYQELRRATIKIQTWWRGILAKRLVEYIRREVSARRLQSASRRFVQRLRFLDTRRAIVLFQSRESRIYFAIIFCLINKLQEYGVPKLGACTRRGRLERRRHCCRV